MQEKSSAPALNICSGTNCDHKSPSKETEVLNTPDGNENKLNIYEYFWQFSCSLKVLIIKKEKKKFYCLLLLINTAKNRNFSIKCIVIIKAI